MLFRFLRIYLYQHHGNIDLGVMTVAISESFLNELKYRLDIVDVISSYTELKRRGHNQVCLCPFHNEKTPSMTVFPQTQSFYCFGCGAGGDAITFIKKIENLEYIEAVRLLAQRAGMTVPEDNVDDAAAKLKMRLLEQNREAARFFYSNLLNSDGKNAYDYIKNRGLTDNTIKRFGIGYAKDSWDSLYKHLSSKGFSDYEILAGNLGVKNKKGGIYDQFRNRLIFPIIDVRGNVIAFGGRDLSDRGPKYLNSSDTPVFKKSRNLFALNIAKSTKQKSFILAEGYMDVIAIHQAGFDNAVATLGTSLTSEQANLISRYTDEVIVAYDSDGAGRAATKRAIEIFDAASVNVRILSYNEAKDPDEYIKRFGAQRFGLLISGCANAIEYQLYAAKKKHDIETNDGKLAYLKDAIAILSSVSNKLERDVYATDIANALSVSKDAVISQIDSQIKRKMADKKKKEDKKLPIAGVDFKDRSNSEKAIYLKAAIAEEELISLLIKNPDYCSFINERIKPSEFVTDFNRAVYEIILKRILEGLSVDMISLSGQLSEVQMAKLSAMISKEPVSKYTKEDAGEIIDVIKSEKNKPDAGQVAGLNEKELKDYIDRIANLKK